MTGDELDEEKTKASQSLIHQVFDSQLILTILTMIETDLVAIPYSSGLRFSVNLKYKVPGHVQFVAIPYSSGLRFSDKGVIHNE